MVRFRPALTSQSLLYFSKLPQHQDALFLALGTFQKLNDISGISVSPLPFKVVLAEISCVKKLPFL